MKFHEYTTLHAASRKIGVPDAQQLPPREWYELALRERMPSDPFVATQIKAERDWLTDDRPYYSVYPAIVPSLLRLSLTLDSGLIHLPLPTLLVRFAEGHELDVLGDGSRLVRSILAARTTVTGGDPGLMLWCDFGETIRDGLFPIFSYRSFRLRAGTTLEETLADIDHMEPGVESEAALTPCVRLVCTLCLLGSDPDLIEPEVLAKDQARYDETEDPALVERAVRRGKVGWRVGHRLEVSPHFRRPHVALRWTGEGRSVPKIVPVKGAVVHRRKLSQVPQGRLDEQE